MLKSIQNTLFSSTEYSIFFPKKKSIQFPRRYLAVSINTSYIRAITLFNNLADEFKTIRNKHNRKIKLKQ